ncbi:MAG: DNA polymerase IV, partial [Gammaproteobacteria bacterium]|nr:DNA polymerase IV [Gammaproteobacteria bacterium]
DMNAFFASVEQRDNPDWKGRPICITNGSQGTTIITSSYEARAYGVKTGMRLPEATRLCPSLIRVPSHPERYAEVSATIMESLYDITPIIEVFSVDEAFLDATGSQRLLGTPLQVAELTKKRVFAASGILCSVGVSGDKTTAKYAAKLKKPDGLTLIPPWEAEKRLKDAPVTALCGINKGVGGYLAQHGVKRCGDMKEIPISVLSRRFGNLGRRIWLMAQGKDPAPLVTEVAAPKSMGHGKVTPPNTKDQRLILTYLHHMSEKLGARLRRYQLVASHYYIAFRRDLGWISEKPRIAPTSDGKQIYLLSRSVFQTLWRGEGVHQIQVTALDPRENQHQQFDLFTDPIEERSEVNAVTDKINQRYGEFTLAPASLLNRSSMPNVISPAWHPSGHRNTL